MRNLWLVFRKELTCCGRDPDVLIYAILLPLVLYPLSAVFVNEASLWYASMQEKNRDTIYVKGVSPLAAAIAQGVRQKKHFNVVDDAPVKPTGAPGAKKSRDKEAKTTETGSEETGAVQTRSTTTRSTEAEADPLSTADMKKNAVATVTVDPTTNEIKIEAVETSSHLGTVAEQVETDIREARFKGLKEKLEEKGISVDILNVFTVSRLDLKKAAAPGTRDGELKQLFDRLLALLVTFTILMMTIIGGPASVCMMAEEHEKKTFLTTLLLPIDRLVIVIAKFLTVTVICVGGAAFNLICLALFVAFLLISVFGHSLSFTQMLSDLQHLTILSGAYYLATGAIFVHRVQQFVQLPSLPELLLILAFFCSTGALLSAIYLCVASYAKTVKSAQMLVSLPMIFLMALPAIAMIPGIQFNWRTALIPIANLLIMKKFENPPALLATVAILEPLLIVILILFWVRRNFENQVEGKNRNKGESVKAS
ncbi:MAG TPA: ABC transporter permease subunit [Drouetiella sp.]|jgi:ABC-type Na+ efflux pump permease subunit